MLLAACADVASRTPARTVRAQRAPWNRESTFPHDARELAGLLPADADRCVVASPQRLAADQLPVAPLLSQLDGLPWLLNLPVSAYARAELQPSNDRRRVREYLRFVEPGRARIRAELDRVLEPRVSWEASSGACKDELTCVVVEAQFLDDRTVMLSTGEWPYGGTSQARACEWLMAAAPDALEVSARNPELSGRMGEGRGAATVVEVRGQSFVRMVRRVYADEGAADGALKRWLSGTQDVPSLAGVAVEATLSRDGLAVEQSLRGSLEDLWLALEDRERLRRALSGEDVPVPADADVDVRDPELVKRHVDQTLIALLTLAADERASGLTALDGLLERARREHPSDDGLSRRHFALRLEQRRDACGAASVAEERLSTGVHNELSWRLAQRRALAGCDEGRLRAELARVYDLDAQASAQMASELAEQVGLGRDYERAEWGYRTALELSERARRERLVNVAGRIPLVALPRLLAYLARLDDDHAAQDLGIHILGMADSEGHPATPSRDLWMAETRAPGRPAVVLAAATWDEAQLEAEGRALAARFDKGALEVAVGVDVIGGPQREGTMVRLSGHVEQGALVIERASRSIADARFALLDRFLVRPLEHITGSHFPPDELLIRAEDASERELVLMGAQSDRAMRCDVDGLTVRCRGPLDDNRASARALLRVAKQVLAREARALWSER
jgi:hypothetical protein